jgi:hypothetical protein
MTDYGMPGIDAAERQALSRRSVAGYRFGSSFLLMKAISLIIGLRRNGTSYDMSANPSGTIQKPRIGKNPTSPAPMSTVAIGIRSHRFDGSRNQRTSRAAGFGSRFSRFSIS